MRHLAIEKDILSELATPPPPHQNFTHPVPPPPIPKLEVEGVHALLIVLPVTCLKELFLSFYDC